MTYTKKSLSPTGQGFFVSIKSTCIGGLFKKSNQGTALDAAKKHNGIIVGLTNYILPVTPPENIDLILETIEANR